MNDRGVASPVGVVLVLGISLVTILAILSAGATVIDDARNDSETSQMENSMSQFSSKASLVGLGESSHQRFALGRAASGRAEVREDAGNVSLFIQPEGESREEVFNRSYGAVVYQNGDTEVAYQGGGVWRGFENSSRMISPPEYHYQSQTLTFPIVRVTGDSAASGRLHGTVSSDTVDRPIYPDPDDATLTNPVENGTVYVRIQSEYCAGWESFFDGRSEGSLEQRCDEADQGTVEVDLTVPFQERFESELIATDQVNERGPPSDSDYEEGSNRASASGQVDNEIEECVENGCGDLQAELGSGEVESGTYNATGSVEFDDETFNTSDGDIDLVIDGDLRIKGENKIDGGGNVTIFLKGDLDVQGSINDGGNAIQLRIYVHSDADEIRLGGDSHVTGIIYAPNTDVEQQGGGSIRGAIVGQTIEVRGDPSNDFEYDDSLEDFETNLIAGETPLTYLHVTENTVKVDLT